MRKSVRALSFITITASILWSILVIVTGKTLLEEVFLADLTDVWILLALNVAALISVLLLLLTRTRVAK